VDGSVKPSVIADVSHPSCRAGAIWDNARIQAAVHTAVYLRPYAEQLGIERYEFSGDDLIVQSRMGRVVWGRPPGEECKDEASADVKLRRLLQTDTTKPDRQERDLRMTPQTDTRLAKSK
jgi:hypothetical protein